MKFRVPIRGTGAENPVVVSDSLCNEHLAKGVLIDFSFIYDELVNKYCSNNGRNAESPIRMLKYLFLKMIYDVLNVNVVERSHFDMSFKYFLEMTPEEDVIQPQKHPI